MTKRGGRSPGEVTIRVKGRNLAITPPLHDLVVHKMGRLERYLDRLSDIEVELCTEKTREAVRHNHVEATAHVPGRTIRVTAENSDMQAAVDEAVDKLYRQLNRKKERMKAHHAGKLADVLPTVGREGGVPEDAETSVDGSAEAPSPLVVERLEMKPQFEDEAIEAMDALGRDFYVFLNARSENLNVVYRRPDGSYGLIEPSPGRSP